MFPRVPDQHKPNKPLVPNGFGVFYVLVSVAYLFFMYFFTVIENPTGSPISLVSRPLTLAACILFGGFMGLLDDWIDVKWRYKAFLPLIAALPLVAFAYGSPEVRTAVSIPFFGTIEFGIYYYFLIIPLLVTVVTNTVNMLGGLNGLETICPAIVMMGLMIISGSDVNLLWGPLVIWLALATLNFKGKIFVGNTGSFAIGMTVAAFAIITDLKSDLVISILPYVFNSLLILLTLFFSGKKADVSFDGKRLISDRVKSLVTLITYHRPMTEERVVGLISLLFVISTFISLAVQWMS